MTATPDSTLTDERRFKADLQRELAELRRTLDERTAERDKALEQQTATAEVLHRSSIPRRATSRRCSTRCLRGQRG